MNLKDRAKDCFGKAQNARLDTEKYDVILDALTDAFRAGADERNQVWSNLILGEPGIQDLWDHLRGDRMELRADGAADMLRYLLDANREFKEALLSEKLMEKQK